MTDAVSQPRVAANGDSPAADESFDVIVIGGGAAGLQAALVLARAMRRVLVLDSNRPRHAATMRAHAVLTRDGVSPSEFRRLARADVEAYPTAEVRFAEVTHVERAGEEAGGAGFRVRARGVRGGAGVDARARSAIVATGMSEHLPEVENLRAFYGTSIHSCLACDGYEHAGKRIALFGRDGVPDLAEQAGLLAQWSGDVTVFASESEISDGDADALSARGIRVDRRRVVGVDGDRDGLSALRVASRSGDGEPPAPQADSVEVEAAFVRPVYERPLDFLHPLEDAFGEAGVTARDEAGRTAIDGLYLAGEAASAEPLMLSIAAGSGARTALALMRDHAARLDDSARCPGRLNTDRRARPNRSVNLGTGPSVR